MVIKYINAFFHRNSRWIFGLFTVIIIVAFMDLMTPGQFSGCAGRRGEIGKVFGRSVDYDELRTLTGRIQLWSHVTQGFEPGEIAAPMAFSQICNLEAARQRGITVSDKEVADAIRSLPAFQGADGKFDLAKFRKFREDLAQSGYTGSDIDESVRMFLTLEKLLRGIRGSVIVTDGEVLTFRAMLKEKFTAYSATYKTALCEKDVKPSSEDLKSYFASHRENYKVPLHFEALLIEFPAADFAGEASKAATAGELKKWYDANSFRYTSTGKDGKSTTKPFEQVQKEVRKDFIAEKSASLALHAAQQFTRDLYDAVGEEKAENRMAIFRKFLADHNKKAVPSGRIDADRDKAGKYQSAELVRQLSAVYLDLPVSQAVPVDGGACVGYLTARTEERLAEFNEVSMKVLADCRKEKAADLARDEAQKNASEFLSLSAEERIKAAKAGKFHFRPVKPFTLESQPDTEDSARIMASARSLLPGNCSQVLPCSEGSLVVFLEKREADQSKPSDKELAELKAVYTNAKMMNAMNEFQNYLNSNCSLTADLR